MAGMKPAALYHGSPRKDLTLLEPREESPGHKLPGTYVFATQHKELAAMFLAPKVAPMQISKFDETYLLVANCTEQAFRAADQGGAIYVIPADTFQKGDSDMPKVEWFSLETVHPSSKELFTSSLDAMQQYGVKVYFADDVTYAAIQHAEDHGWQLLSGQRAFDE